MAKGNDEMTVIDFFFVFLNEPRLADKGTENMPDSPIKMSETYKCTIFYVIFCSTFKTQENQAA